MAELELRPGDLVALKHRCSGFFGTDMDLLLRDMRIDQLIMCGVVTNICVRSTIHDAFFRGYDMIVPHDACAGAGRGVGRQHGDAAVNGTLEGDPESDFSLEAHNAHLIRRAHQRATTTVARMMGEIGLTPTQLAVLATLKRYPDLPQSTPGQRTVIDGARLSGMLRRLQAARLVERCPPRGISGRTSPA